MVERRLEIALSERDSINSLTMKSRFEKSSRVKLGPLGKTERDAGLEEFMDALSGILVVDGSHLPAWGRDRSVVQRCD